MARESSSLDTTETFAYENDFERGKDELHEEIKHSSNWSLPSLRKSLPRNIKARSAWILLDVLVILFILYGAYNVSSRIISWSSAQKVPFARTYEDDYAAKYNEEPCSCGSSVAEALSLGCKYDELSAGWLPDRCRDDDLTAEFSKAGDGPGGLWNYWADINNTVPLSVHDISLYADHEFSAFFMSWEWHKQHCLFHWRKEHRLKARGKFYDPDSDNEKHILHCMKVITVQDKGSTAGASLVG